MASEKALHSLHKLLSSKKRGEQVTPMEILRATNWAHSTLRTYVNKNKFTAFLEEQPGGTFKTTRNGDNITYSDIHAALSQKTQAAIILARNLRLSGKQDVYILEQELGRGATAHVWKAKSNNDKGIVALKIINPRPDLLDPSVFRNISHRFERESINGISLNHKHLIKILDHGKYRGTPFLAMERAIVSVKELLVANGKFSIKEADIIIRQCVSALKYLHKQKCIHRDIKPGNILKTNRGYVLADLGIVRWSDLNPAFLEAGTITTASMNLGSLNYMAPEQSNDAHTVNHKADIYSLGVTWYEMVAGNRSSPQAFAAKRAEPPSNDKKLNDLIASMTEYNPLNRPKLTEIKKFLSKRLTE